MIRTMRIPAALLATAVLCPQAHAEWKTKAEAGYVMARGNTETDSANSKFDVSYESDHWKHSLALAALYGTSNEIKSAERWDGRIQTDYRFNGRTYVFVAARHEQDHFNGFDYQSSATTGLGYDISDTERTRFTATLGAGYRRLRPEELIKDLDGNVIQRIRGERSENVVGNATMKLEHRLTESTRVLDALLVEAGEDNTLAQNDLSLEVSMTDSLALALGYRVRHNTEPSPGLEQTERLTTVNLVYKIE